MLPEYRRHLVAGALLQAQFDRSAYGCRLYCCWCAQDLKANEFWAAMGFTPIAFRTGSRTKGERRQKAEGRGQKRPALSSPPTALRPLPTSARIHISWQKRVRAGDVTTPWWYPAKTEGGEMREDRLVFPIPPGVGWRDVLPVVLPEPTGATTSDAGATVCGTPQAVPGFEDTAGGTRPWHPRGEEGRAASTELARRIDSPPRRVRATKAPNAPVRPAGVHAGGFWFAEPVAEPTAEEIAAEKARLAADKAAARAEAKARQKALGAKVDPRFVAMARELRDRWTEQADAILALPGKHDVKRLAGPTTGLTITPQTPAALAPPTVRAGLAGPVGPAAEAA